jgi:hypothetical protein
MDFFESSLRRRHGSVSRFIAPSVTLRDVRCLKAQIELRGLALKDIEAICRGLRPPSLGVATSGVVAGGSIAA